MSAEIYDLLVLGAGPAGLAVGIYGARSRRRVGLVTKGPIGGQAVTTAELENYPGFGRGSTGPQVISALMDHAKQMGAEFIFDEAVDLEIDDRHKVLKGKKGDYRGRTLIIATGAEPRLLQIPGEKEFWGKGVSYCATCDAELYEDKEVVVVGSGDAAMEEALYLTRFASKVSLVVLHDEGHVDANPSTFEKALGNPKITWLWNSSVVSINGQEQVKSVTLKNLRSGDTAEYPTDGVFVFIGTEPHTGMLRDLIELDDNGYIKTDERMRTSRAGVFAAGDVRVKYLRQVVTAVADGAVAAVAAERYLDEWEFFEKEILKAAPPVLVGYYDPQRPASLDSMQQADLWTQKQGGKVKLVRVDASRNEMLTERYRLNTVPAFQLFRQGELKLTMRGRLDVEKLQQEVKG